MDAPTPTRKPSNWPLLAVILLALVVRVWVVARAEVAARDSVGFIKYALEFESKPFAEVLRTAEQPPGYPLAVMIASWPVRAITGGTTPTAMVLGAQIASTTLAVLLVFPLVWLGEELVSRRTGLIAAALFQCLPSWVRITSDGLSESTFLFFCAIALWLTVRCFRLVGGVSDRSRGSSDAPGSPLLIALLAGLVMGCAYFTRPEGAELAAAAVAVFGFAAVLRRIPHRTAVVNALAIVVGFSLFLGPFYLTTGRLTNKPTARYLLGDPSAKKTYFSSTGGLPLAVWWSDNVDKSQHPLLWAGKSLADELADGSRYVGLALAVVGVTWAARRYRSPLGLALLVTLTIMHVALLVKMCASMGYLSERHTALLMLCGCVPAAVGLEAFVDRLWRGSVPAWAFPCILGLGFVTALPSLAKPLHGNRAGHRAAGEWLALHAPASAGICDPFCWAHYYAGRVFHESAAHDPPDQFAVVEGSDNQHSRLPLLPEAKAKAAAGQLVYHWPENVAADKAKVRVYRWRRPPNEVTTPNPNRSSIPSSAGG